MTVEIMGDMVAIYYEGLRDCQEALNGVGCLLGVAEKFPTSGGT